MSRYAFTPEVWITAELPKSALRTLLLIATYADTRTGKCWPSNAELANTLRKTERAVQYDINAAIQAGFISIVEFNGRKRTLKIESPEWFDRPKVEIANPDEPFSLAEPRRNSSHQPRRNSSGQTRSESSCHEENLRGRGEEILPAQYRTLPVNSTNELPTSPPPLTEESKPVAPARPEPDRPGGWADRSLTLALDLIDKAGMDSGNHRLKLSVVNLLEAGHTADSITVALARLREYELGNEVRDYFRFMAGWMTRGGSKGHRSDAAKPAAAEPRELVNARNALSMAERLLPKGESTPEEVERYRIKVETLARKAGIA